MSARKPSRYSCSFWVEEERYWQLSLEGTKEEATTRAAWLLRNGHPTVRVRKVAYHY